MSSIPNFIPLIREVRFEGEDILMDAQM